MSWSLKKIFAGCVVGVTTTALMTYSIGLSDRESAENHLTSQNYKVLRYDGHTSLLKHHGELYADKFRVEDSTGHQQEVVVARDLHGKYDVRRVNTLKKDMPEEKKEPYNPFKMPNQP